MNGGGGNLLFTAQNFVVFVPPQTPLHVLYKYLINALKLYLFAFSIFISFIELQI